MHTSPSSAGRAPLSLLLVLLAAWLGSCFCRHVSIRDTTSDVPQSAIAACCSWGQQCCSMLPLPVPTPFYPGQQVMTAWLPGCRGGA